jgi:6-phosphogluconolactonase (cycloisomerase 2 family)
MPNFTATFRLIMGGHRTMEHRQANSVLPEIGRRSVLAAGALGVAGLLLPIAVGRAADPSGPMFVYVGSYTKNPPGGGSNNPVGLSVFKFDPATGALSPVQQVQSANPSFVALHPSRRFLYVINEIDDYEGRKSGSAEAYAIDPNTGMITLLNRQSLNSPIPAHLAVDPTGRQLVVANYIGGDFVVLPIEADGRLGPVSGNLKDTGSGPNKDRQEAPHPHSVVFDPAGRFIAAADLGIDKVQIFRLADGGLARVSEAPVAPGAGPRHLAFDLAGKHLYVLAELNATVTVFPYDPATGQIGQALQTISTEPAGYNGPHSTAEIAVHPSGKFLYASNRGHNSIVGYRIDPSTGLLSLIGFAPQGVKFPRNFAIDPSGKWLYVANQKGDTIVQFEIDPQTGELKPSGQVTPSITPVAIVFRTAG